MQGKKEGWGIEEKENNNKNNKEMSSKLHHTSYYINSSPCKITDKNFFSLYPSFFYTQSKNHHLFNPGSSKSLLGATKNIK